MDVIQLHQFVIGYYGGIAGVRDLSLLESALARPFQTFDGRDLYKSVEEKSAALLESLIANHPFYDGNKRTGYLTFRLFLLNNGRDIAATEIQKYDFIINIAEGKSKFEEIVQWINAKVVAV